ncbi:N-acetyltransferase family protein [Arenibacterium sp. LLYu02]|uniref:GNAT family N-acetyltransferase n=1 Tax=Arenibacterium sp. LLYu02 TaxID=3404132 RepID=UPI003B223EA8
MTCVIRPAREGDTEAIAALHRLVVDTTLMTFTTQHRALSDWQNDIHADPPLLLAETETGAFLGFAYLSAFRKGPGYAHSAEHSIYLIEASRGRGVGRKLLTAVENQARQQGIHVLVAGISGANPAAQAFHAACGYAEVGRMPEVGHKWGQWLDLVLMQKILREGPPA